MNVDYMFNKLPKCPHCRADFPVWSGDNLMDLKYGDGDRTTFTCQGCGKDFVAVTLVQYQFHTAVSEEAADDDEYGPPEIPETDDGGEALPGLPL